MLAQWTDFVPFGSWFTLIALFILLSSHWQSLLSGNGARILADISDHDCRWILAAVTDVGPLDGLEAQV